jgi:DNA-binding XRE family transcriptional regulator
MKKNCFAPSNISGSLIIRLDTHQLRSCAVDTKEAAANSQIDPASAESFIAEKRIGERIKRLRLKKSMGLVELGRHTGLSASFLSQLETGRVVPTLRNLARVAMVFQQRPFLLL